MSPTAIPIVIEREKGRDIGLIAALAAILVPQS
jgi:hypothetical protein